MCPGYSLFVTKDQRDAALQTSSCQSTRTPAAWAHATSCEILSLADTLTVSHAHTCFLHHCDLNSGGMQVKQYRKYHCQLLLGGWTLVSVRLSPFSASFGGVDGCIHVRLTPLSAFFLGVDACITSIGIIRSSFGGVDACIYVIGSIVDAQGGAGCIKLL